MASHILKCDSCSSYLISEKCKCGGKGLNPRPPKYSPEDPYSDYRRKAKEKERKDIGVL